MCDVLLLSAQLADAPQLKFKADRLCWGERMYYFKEAQTQNEFQKFYRLRYKIYCLDEKWLNASDYPDKQEKDFYDEHSEHYHCVK